MDKSNTFWLSAVISTLAYSDVFNHPLTGKELWQRLITPLRIKREEFSGLLVGWQKEKKIILKNGYYFLPGRASTIQKRKKKEKMAEAKIELAKKSAKVLAKIPFVWGVFLSGNLALNTATLNDDIDLVIVSAPKTLWLTRFIVYLFLKTTGGFFGLKVRIPGSRQTKDKLCLNLFLDYCNLEINLQKQNLFTAYQILFLKPLENKNQTYQRFWNTNSWVASFFANGYRQKKFSQKNHKFSPFFSFANRLLYSFQLFYMKGKPRGEKISLTQAFFHPDSKELKILNLYQKKCKNLSVPLDI